jgi:predicted RNase H-like HicB family nuclease
MNFYKVNIDYIIKDGVYLASYPEIPALTAEGSSHALALTALESLYTTYAGITGSYLPTPLSSIKTY